MILDRKKTFSSRRSTIGSPHAVHIVMSLDMELQTVRRRVSLRRRYGILKIIPMRQMLARMTLVLVLFKLRRPQSSGAMVNSKANPPIFPVQHNVQGTWQPAHGQNRAIQSHIGREFSPNSGTLWLGNASSKLPTVNFESLSKEPAEKHSLFNRFDLLKDGGNEEILHFAGMF